MSNVLVAYFSASGTTAKLSKRLAEAIGDSAANMQALSPNAKVENGERFAASASEAMLKEWAEGIVK